MINTDIPSGLIEKMKKGHFKKTLKEREKLEGDNNEVKEIIGYHCNKAIVNVNNEAQDAFTVYYTDKINIETPNWCNEYVEIPGVLLEYQYEKYGVCMRFTASKIEFKKVDDEEFLLPTGYTLISEPEMDKEMQEIFDSFK